MTSEIGFILDGIILVFLCVTIFYAARLSLFLKSFREGKEGVQLLIRDLSATVDKADESIKVMKLHAQETENSLRDIIHKAKFHSDELRFMNEAGDNLADRLEKLADRNRELIDLMESAGGIGVQKIKPIDPKPKDPWDRGRAAQPKKAEPTYEDDFEISDFEIDEDDERDFNALEDGAYIEEDAHKSKVDTQAKSKVRSFAIFDREHMGDVDEDIEIKNDLASPARQTRQAKEAAKEQQFYSQAEQDLYEALQRRKKSSSGGKSAHKVSEIT